MFNTVLIANRGEIACRAIRTLNRLGITSVAVYSDADKNAEHVRQADIALALGGEKASDSYLKIDSIIQAARDSGAQAIWPGYGFLSESLPFADACEQAGIVFIGPTAQQIGEFGLKHRARELAAQAGVPMTPGTGLLNLLDDALEAAQRIGYPVMLKSTAGGGGIGLTRCADAEALAQGWESVRRLGEQFFSDAGVFVERCIDRARHIEVQIFGDGNGNVVALGERDCSLQRRNQKVVEETPAPNLPAATRAALLDAAVQLGKLVNYRSAGTVEFIYDAGQDAFYFLEVNTRLQVEHPVTECVTGLDLVECMLRVAAGETIDWARMAKAPQGAAIEVRIYAENPLKNFQPSPGVLTEVVFPDNVRIDTGVATGSEVSAFYDPMIAKLIVHADTREAALSKLHAALNATRLHGIATNLDYLRQITASEAFISGTAWTRMLDNVVARSSVIEVLQPGTWSSVQDYPGRQGYWDIGVPPSGPMDDFAFRLANRIVGNHESAAGLEFTLQGPVLQFHSDALIALTGADCQALLDGEAVAMWQPVSVKAGQTLALGRAQTGCRAYLAVRNGLDVPEYLGSRSTFALGQFGGHAGRTLRVADQLPISRPELAACTTPAPISEAKTLSPALIPAYGEVWRIGVLYGPHGAPDFFTPESIDEFFASDWQVHYNSNRLGVRLVGPKPSWTRPNGGEAGLHPSNVHDCEYAIGAINFTGDFPVILTRDGPSLGGFVCPVTIAKAELWKVGQVKPGDRIRFYPMSVEDAVAREKAMDRSIETLQTSVLPTFAMPSLADRDGVSAASLVSLPATCNIPAIVYRQAGDNYILIEYGENVLDLALRLRVHVLMAHLRERAHPGIKELSPGVRSLQVRYDSRDISQQALVTLLLELETRIGDVSQMTVPSRIVHLPMAFEDSATLDAVSRYADTVRASAPWLPNNVDFIQRINGLPNREAVKETIFDASYLILGLGDVYLGAPCAVPVDPRHRLLSSKYNPARTFTAEGTVGIGGMYMCIYGMDSPGGYQLVGRTLPIWNKFLKNDQFSVGEPWLLRFFDQVRFYPVSESELDSLREDFREGRAAIRIEETVFDFTAHLRFLEEHADDIARFRQHQSTAFDAEVERWQRDEQQPVSESLMPTAEVVVDEEALPVTADMNGNIWKVLVNPGDTVEAGQTLIIVEAMKMELAIHAPQAGRVKHIGCQPGRPVSPGDVLLWLEERSAA
ncbi:urea carboxylase [Kluyvera ascorbata]|uniref:urea carboxylase n=1 Tax=Kluyvera ascorbata TaxID=51288 RepID=UPI00200EBC97|nr:urea carboxylase [Kluyvera ascorbata]